MSVPPEVSAISRKRDPAIEAYRGLAILLVVMGHAQVIGFRFAGAEHGTWNFYVSLLGREVSSCANAVFLAISGYLLGAVLIESKAQYAAFLRKRLARVLIPYLIWSVVFTAVYGALGRPFSVPDFLLRLAIGGVDGPYYFIVLLMQCYLLMPVCQKLANTRYAFHILVPLHLAYIALVYVIRLRVLTADSYLGLPVYMFYNVPFLAWFTFFFLGVYLRSYPAVLSRIRPQWLAMGVLVCYFAAWAESLIAAHFGHVEFATSTVRFPCMAYSAFVVLLLFKLRDKAWPSFLHVLSDCAFGIYFTHMFLIRIVDRGLMRVHALYAFQPAYQLVMVVGVVVACLLGIAAMRRIFGKRFAKDYLGL